MQNFKTLIIGGGASGMAAALSLKETEIGIIEALPRLGKKLSSTGNGKCNLTNLKLNSSFFNDKPFLDEFFKNYTTDSIVSFFHKLGVEVKADSDGRVYPVSETASSIVDSLRYTIEERNIPVFLNQKVTSISKKNTFIVSTAEQQLCADKVIVCCGSPAGDFLDSLDIIKPFVKTRKMEPSLAPIMTEITNIRGLRGIRVKCQATLLFDNSAVVTETGEVLFKENGLSGIAIFNLSKFLSQMSNVKNADVSLSFLYDEGNVADFLEERLSILKEVTLERFFVGLFHKMLAKAIVEYAGFSLGDIMDKSKIQKLADAISSFKIRIKGTGAMSQAQACSGGVLLDQIDRNTLEAKNTKGLYFCGEILDVDGLCGGYNLSWAWCSAFAVANAINEKSKA